MVYVGSLAVEEQFEEAEREYFGEGHLRKRDPIGEWILLSTARSRLRLIHKYKPKGGFCDIGCGTGELLAQARAMGYEVVGVEFSEALVRYAKQRYGLEVHCGDLTNFVPTVRFDVVVLSHVLEHVLDPVDMLRRATRLLAPTGILYVATPNIGSWEAHFDGWGSYEPYHLSYFSAATLRGAIERAGGQIVSLGSREPESAWFNTALRGMLRADYSRVRLAVQHDEQGVARRRYRSAIIGLNIARLLTGFVLTPLRSLQACLLRGEELMCIATLQPEAE